MENVIPRILNSTFSKTKRVNLGFLGFLSEWIGEGPFDTSAFGVCVKKLQKAICDGVKLLRANVMGMRSFALPKDDQRRVACLSRRRGVFARHLLPGCPSSRVPLRPLKFQMAVQRAFGVPLTFTRALAGQTVRH